MNSLSAFFGKSLRRRFLLVNGAFLLCSSLCLSAIFFTQIRATLNTEFEKRGWALAGLLATESWSAMSSADSLITFDGDQNAQRFLQDVAQVLSQEEDVAFAGIANPEGKFLAHRVSDSHREEFNRQILESHALKTFLMDAEISHFTTVVCRNHMPSVSYSDPKNHSECILIGQVHLGLSPARMLSEVQNALWRSVGLALLISILGLGLVWLITTWVLRPITKMNEVVREVAAGNFTARIQATTDDEIGSLGKALNEMSWTLADQQEELASRNKELQLVATEKERLYTNAQIRATRLEVMNELAKAMASSLDTEEIYGHVYRQLRRLMEFEYFTVQRFLKKEHMFRRDYVWMDSPVVGVEVGQKIKTDNSPIRRVQRTKMPLSIPDFEKDALLSDGWLSKAGLKSGFIVPIVAGDEFLGVLGLACKQKNAFARVEVATVFAIADTLAVVLKNADLYQRLQTSFVELTETQHRLAKSEHVRRAEKLRSVGQMASGIAHNFNNVMSAIIGRVQFLKLKALKGEMDEKAVNDCLNVVERAALDGAETVRRLQEFSRGAKATAVEKTDMNELIRSVIQITRPRWKDQPEQRGIHIDVETDLQDLSLAACVPGEIREVLTNLIFNAVDAMPEGGTMTFQTRETNDRAEIVVSDTGLGMPKDVRDRVFDPFFTTKGVQGSGLGLSTVYGIIERHGGSIGVVSEQGKGSKFRIRIPLAEKDTPQNEGDPMMSSQPWRILVGDDEPNVREALVDLLRLLGHKVVAAHDGESTLKAFGEHDFDLVFTDLGMPDMSGWEVTAAIRKSHPDIPIVLATGWGSEIEDDHALERGVTRVLAKPFTVQKVSSLIAELQGIARRRAA